MGTKIKEEKEKGKFNPLSNDFLSRKTFFLSKKPLLYLVVCVAFLLGVIPVRKMNGFQFATLLVPKGNKLKKN
jgi:hypothetical protein